MEKVSCYSEAQHNRSKVNITYFPCFRGNSRFGTRFPFPVDTWKGHENGLRKDLAQALADIKPGVFRFPGGCIVEGTDLATRYDWKNQ